jgi:hypothetical protein
MRSRGFPAEPNGAGSRPSGRADGGANLGIALQGDASPLPLVDQRVLRRGVIPVDLPPIKLQQSRAGSPPQLHGAPWRAPPPTEPS